MKGSHCDSRPRFTEFLECNNDACSATSLNLFSASARGHMMESVWSRVFIVVS